MIFLSTPSVYNLPGTWEKQPDVIIPHLHLTPDQGLILFFGLLLLSLVVYGIYMTFGAGLELNGITIDISYLSSTSKIRNPLENTLRFSLSFNFDGFSKASEVEEVPAYVSE